MHAGVFVDVNVKVAVSVGVCVLVAVGVCVNVLVGVGVLVGADVGEGESWACKIGKPSGGMAFHTVSVSQHVLVLLPLGQ